MNTAPIVTVSSKHDTKSLYNVVPNFMFIDKPTTKVVGKKTIKTKKLIIWFDIRNEHDDKFDINEMSPYINLKNFSFQLLSRKDGNFELMKPLNTKEEVTVLRELIIRRDFDGLEINPQNTLTYEVDADQFTGEIDLQYQLKYLNDQKLGLTIDGKRGENAGHIVISENKNPFIFNNAFAYLENNQEKVIVLDREEVNVNKREILTLDAINEPIVEISSKSVVRSEPTIALSEQLRGELARLQVDRVSYLQSAQKDLKIVKNNDSYQAYWTRGNHYDFQTNKYLENPLNSLKSIDDSTYKFTFEYNHRKLEIGWDIHDLPVVIKNLKNKHKQLEKYITYQNVKPNTKFQTFISNRQDKLWR